MEGRDCTPDGLRERKKRQTRVALGWAAIRLSVERGYQNVRIEDIAAAANVSVRTFRNYFSSKAEAIAYRNTERAVQIAAELRARPVGEPIWPAISNAVLARFTLSREPDGQGSGDDAPDPHWRQGVALLLTDPALQAEISRVGAAAQRELTAAVAARTGTDADRDMYPRLVAASVGGAITAATSRWLRDDPPVPLADLLRDALRQIAAGLPDPGSADTTMT